MKILAVDDDYISRMKMQAVMAKYGNVDTVESGEKAFAMLKKTQKTSEPYQLCTMDIEMPGWSGQETVEKIREWEVKEQIEDKKKVKIIMVTIKKDDGNIMDSFFKGCEWYIKKPVNPENIQKALMEIGLIQI